MSASSRRNLRRVLHSRDDLCHYCRQPFDCRPWGNPTIEHRTPKARGGRSDRSNVVLACRGCNEVKQDMTDAEYRYFLNTGDLHPEYIAHLTDNTRKRARTRAIHIGTNGTISSVKIVPPFTPTDWRERYVIIGEDW